MNGHQNMILYGSSAPLPVSRSFQAGPLTLVYECGSLRYICYKDIEILRMIYSAVRDHNWGTVPARMYNEEIRTAGQSFHITYQADYRENDINFTAVYSISGTEDGRMRFHMQGKALTAFKKNRIGFCMLHPVNECIGQTCRITHPNGEISEGLFPTSISPHQPFKGIQSMQWNPGPGVTADLHCSGDVFEMEDQRNWTDASYKTYCTPLEKPFPVTLSKGDLVEQTVELRIYIAPNARVSGNQLNGVVFSAGTRHIGQIPHIGLSQSSMRSDLTSAETQLLRALKLDHLRADIKLYSDNWKTSLLAARTCAGKIGVPLDIALYPAPDVKESVKEFAWLCNTEKLNIKFIRLFSYDSKSTDTETLQLAVPLLRDLLPRVEIGAGTDCFFTELNRERTPVNLIDFLTFSINPQVHAFDIQSLTETLEAQKYVVESAREFAGGRDIHVSPVTLKMRFNPNATGPDPEPQPDELPSDVDTRQLSLYGAGWTLGSLKYLIESGADALTYFETVGWKGVIMGDQASSLPDKFPADSGQVFPLYQVFKWLLEYKDGAVIESRSSDPLVADGLILERNGDIRMLLANFTPQTVSVRLPYRNVKHMAVLDELGIHAFMNNPSDLKSTSIELQMDTVDLQPFAVICLDIKG